MIHPAYGRLPSEPRESSATYCFKTFKCQLCAGLHLSILLTTDIKISTMTVLIAVS